MFPTLVATESTRLQRSHTRTCGKRGLVPLSNNKYGYRTDDGSRVRACDPIF
jgi:hypothetical protein